MWKRAGEIKTAEAKKEERDSEGQKNNNKKQPQKENIEIIVSEKFKELMYFNSKLVDRLVIESRYKVHIKKQSESFSSYKLESKISLPVNLNYRKIGGLSKECVLAFEKTRPLNLASASKIPGITPAALTSVLLYTKKKNAKSKKQYKA